MRIVFMTVIPSRAAGLSRLASFISLAGRNYAQRRNSDMGQGQHNDVSMLSPYIRHRLIEESEVVSEVLSIHSAAQSEKFVQEVFWRTYFKGWLEQRPQVWTRYQQGVETHLNVLAKDKTLRRRYDSAVLGQTGIKCFDYWSRELRETGYLHNHARMWFASIWIFTLKLPWELGADFFLRHLLDGDPASNTLSWRWVGGLHTKGKTYLARPDNIERFTNGRFNPVGQLATHAESLTEPEETMPDQALPQSVVLPHSAFLLLVHEDDCHPESLLCPSPLLQDRRLSGVIGALATPLRSPLAVDTKVLSFTHAAVSDALTRCGSDRSLIDGDWAGPLIAACEQDGVKHIVTAYVPVGPSAQALAKAMPEFERAGITVTQITRPWDRLTWPYANRGFFKVKKKVPKILEDLKQNDIQVHLI